MKRYKPLIILCTLFVFSACMKDKGNYDYTDINEIGISGIEGSYDVLIGETLEINPILNLTKDDGSDPDRYTYEWFTTDVENGKLATSRNLNQPITLVPGDYKIYYRVTDKVTGVQWATSFNLSVQTSTYEGWLLLADVGGKARLDMISLIRGEYTPIPDVLAYTGSALKLEGAPVDLAFTSYGATPSQRIYVTASESGTTTVNPATFGWQPENALAYETLMSIPDNFGADFIQPKGYDCSSYMYKDSNIYYYSRNFYMRYSVPVNIVQGEATEFKAAPFLAAGYEKDSWFYTALFYDATNKRFVRHAPTSQFCTGMPADTLFNYKTGMDMVYMTENTFNNGQIFAILKDPVDSKYYLARIRSTEGNYVQSYWGELEATDIHLAEHFAVSPVYGYIFYNVGTRIYQYDIFLKQTKLMMDTYPQQISMLRFRTFFTDKPAYTQFATKLAVATYDPTGPEGSNGEFSLYTVPPVNRDLVLFERYAGFGKIVDMEYLER